MWVSVRIFAALWGAGLAFAGAASSPAWADPASTNLAAPLSNAKQWHLQVLGKAKATLTRAAGAAAIKVSATDGTDYHAQLQCLGPKLKEGQAYTLRFSAKADAKRFVAVYALINSGDYHGIGLRQTAALETRWRTFEYTFRAQNLGRAALACPVFSVGNAVGAVSFSAVSLTPAPVGAALTPPSDPPTWALQRFDPCVATLKNDGDTHIVTISNTDETPWHVQLNRLGSTVKDGQVYTIRFRVKADTPGSILLAGQVGDGDFHPLFDPVEVGVETDWREYTYHVIPHNSDGHPVLFPQFLLGNQTGTVWIDGVTVTAPNDASAASL